jgi:hypothetical protein
MDVNRPLTLRNENEGERNGCVLEYVCPLQLTSEGTENEGVREMVRSGYYPLSPNGTQQAWAANGANVGNGKVGELAIFKSVPSTSAIL